MKILLSFYPDLKIRQLSNHTATMWLSNDYDLFIDVNANPGSWTAQRKRGNIRNDMMLRGGRVPKDDVEKADALISRYQEALVSHVMEMEEKEKSMIKKDVEVLKWHKKHKPQPQTLADPEEVQGEEREKVVMPMVMDLIQHGLKPAPADPEEAQEKAEAAQRLEENLKEYLELTKAPEKPINQALPEEPNLEEIQEAPVDLEGSQPLPGPIISPSAYQKFQENALEVHFPTAEEFAKGLSESILAAQNEALPEEPNLEEIQDAPADPEGEEEVKSSQPEEEIKKPYSHPLGSAYCALPCHPFDPEFKNLVSPEEAADLNTWEGITKKIIQDMDAAKLQPGENYSEKIESKSKEILKDLWDLINWAHCLASLLPSDLHTLISKLEENLEVLQLLQDCQARQEEIEENLNTLQMRQDFQALYLKDPALQKQAELNEVYINKNSKGYSWRITARAADMEEAVKYALFADEVCKGIQKKGAGDNES